MDKYYSYEEVFLKPRYSSYHHRREVGLLTTIRDRAFRLSVIPSNMKCVIDVEKARFLSECGYFYIMHRFGKKNSLTKEEIDIDNRDFVLTANIEKWKTISISLGVNDRDRDLLDWCARNGLRIDYITVDISHGHSVGMKEMLEFIKKGPYNNSYIVAGNVATPIGVQELYEWGADMVKVGIAQGGACTTFGKTGFGTPMFTTILECSKVSILDRSKGFMIYIPIIADGGIRSNGDIAKALVAGAKMVMAGQLFAACKDSPADEVYSVEKYLDGDLVPRERKILTHKAYYGSASEHNTHNFHHIEGTLVNLPVSRWTYAEKLVEIEEDLQSSITFAGGDFSSCDWGVRNV